MEHEVKICPQFYEAIRLGLKTHYLRKSSDREYKVNDILNLQEFDNKRCEYTGRQQRVLVTYVTSSASPCAYSEEGLDNQLCILSICLVDTNTNDCQTEMWFL